MILYKRVKDDKSGKLEKIKEIEFPTENLLVSVRKTIHEVMRFSKSNEIFFIIFSEEEEKTLLNLLKLFLPNPINMLFSVFNDFFDKNFHHIKAFPLYVPMKNGFIHPVVDELNDIKPKLCVQFSLG